MHDYTESSIVTLEGFKHIQFRKSQYGFTPFGKDGILLMCKEILDNIIDEVQQTPNQPHVVNIYFIRKRNTFQMIATDTGRGIPLKMLEPVFTKENTSGKWLDAYDTSAGSNGVGAKGVAALSTYFTAITRRPEGMAHLVIKDASIVRSKIVMKKRGLDTGTSILFEPSPSHMPSAAMFFEEGGGYSDFIELVRFASVNCQQAKFTVHHSKMSLKEEDLVVDTPDELWNTLHHTGPHLTSITDTIYYHDETYLQYLLGIKQPESLLQWDSGWIVKDQIKVPVTIQTGLKTKTHANMGFSVQWLITDPSYANGPQILSSVNGIRMKGKTSSQVYTMLNTLKVRLSKYVDAKYIEFFNTSYILPIHIIAIVKYQHAAYHNQDKSKFVDADFETGFKEALLQVFETISEDRWITLFELIKQDLEIKWQRKYKRTHKLSSDSKNLAFRLHKEKCYYECRNTGVGTELLIAEGTSSGDWIKQHRDPSTQAVFELTGKILNVFSKGDGSLEVMRKNGVIDDLIQVLGTSPEDEDLTDFRFEKIGIITDSDPDGCHITALVLGCLYFINPKLFSEKRVFLLNPPLYIAHVKGCKDPIFIRDNSVLDRFKSTFYQSLFDLSMIIRGKDTPVGEDEFHAIITMIKHVSSSIGRVAAMRSIDPGLLEGLMHCIPELKARDGISLAKKLGYVHCEFNHPRNLMILYDAYKHETVVNLFRLVETIESEFSQLMVAFKLKDHYFTINSKLQPGDPIPLNYTGIHLLLEDLDTRYTLHRIKGIGEMAASHLVTTCLDRATRSTTIVSDDEQFEIAIRQLMGVDSTARKELVLEHMETTTE